MSLMKNEIVAAIQEAWLELSARDRTYVILEDDRIMTAMTLAEATGVKADSLSSVLKQMTDEGLLGRVVYGPKGGFGYYVTPEGRGRMHEKLRASLEGLNAFGDGEDDGSVN